MPDADVETFFKTLASDTDQMDAEQASELWKDVQPPHPQQTAHGDTAHGDAQDQDWPIASDQDWPSCGAASCSESLQHMSLNVPCP